MMVAGIRDAGNFKLFGLRYKYVWEEDLFWVDNIGEFIIGLNGSYNILNIQSK